MTPRSDYPLVDPQDVAQASALESLLGGNRRKRDVYSDLHREEARRKEREHAYAASKKRPVETAALRTAADLIDSEPLLQLRFREGLTIAEIAEREGVSVSTVHLRIARILEANRNLF